MPRPTRTGDSGSSACPRPGCISSAPSPGRAIEPYLNAVTHRQRYRGAQADRDDHRGPPRRDHHRAPDRPGNRPARPGQARQLRQAADEPERRVSRHGTWRRGRPNVQDDRPARRGAHLRQRAAGRRRPIPGPASARSDKGKGIGGPGDGEASTIRSTVITPTRSSTSPPTPRISRWISS